MRNRIDVIWDAATLATCAFICGLPSLIHRVIWVTFTAYVLWLVT